MGDWDQIDAEIAAFKAFQAQYNAGKKDLELPIVSGYATNSASWPSLSFGRLRNEGYNVNAAVGACIGALVFASSEPRPVVKDKKGEPVGPDHPLQALLDRPNAIMSHGELLELAATYKAVGGNAYLHKVRNRTGQVVELWPYHVGHIAPVPGLNKWIAEYEYDVGDGRKQRIPAEDIVHLKWPVVDLEHPWMALAPLQQIAREVDSDTEMTRMLYAFLRNDATPRALVVYPEGTTMTAEQKEHMRQIFQAHHGGDNRGGIGFITGGANIHRLALNMQELDLTALRSVPEARICAGFRVPPEVAGLSVGMAHSTENNLAAADVRFTQRTLVPMWKRDAGELTRDLAAEFGDGLTIEYDLSEVAALQEDETAKVTRTVALFEKNGILVDELREAIGLPPLEDVLPDLHADRGKMFFYELKPTPPPAPQQPNIIDVTGTGRQPPQLTAELQDEIQEDEAEEDVKAIRAEAFKAIRRTSTETLEQRMARELAELYGETWQKVGGSV